MARRALLCRIPIIITPSLEHTSQIPFHDRAPFPYLSTDSPSKIAHLAETGSAGHYGLSRNVLYRYEGNLSSFRKESYTNKQRISRKNVFSPPPSTTFLKVFPTFKKNGDLKTLENPSDSVHQDPMKGRKYGYKSPLTGHNERNPGDSQHRDPDLEKGNGLEVGQNASGPGRNRRERGATTPGLVFRAPADYSRHLSKSTVQPSFEPGRNDRDRLGREGGTDRAKRPSPRNRRKGRPRRCAPQSPQAS